MVNIPAGSQVELLVEDSTGDEAWSGTVSGRRASKTTCDLHDRLGDQITVQNSSDASCVDPNAAKALNADKSTVASSSGASPSGSSSAGTLPTASTTFALPTFVFTCVPAFMCNYSFCLSAASSGYAAGVAQSASPSGLANAAGSGGAKASPSSGSIPSAALPAGSLLGIAAFLLTVIHL